MNLKSKLRHLLGDKLANVPIVNLRDRVVNKQAIKNLEVDSQPGCFVRILARDELNAKEIGNVVVENKQELNVENVHFSEQAIHYNSPDYNNEPPVYNCSVLLKINPRYLFCNVLSKQKSDFKSLREEIGENNQRIVIDFSSPNIAKPFHYGHLKSTIHGNYLANLNQFTGNHVTKLNYIGDWGTQYGLLNLGLEEEKEAGNQGGDIFGNSPLRYLLDVYVRANERGRVDERFFTEAKQRFVEMSTDVDSIPYKRWKEIRDLSIKELRASYDELAIQFDEFDYESDYASSSIDVVAEMEAKKLLTRSEDGLKVAKISKNNRLLDVNILKSDGTSLYLTRDVAAAMDRMKRFNFDKMLYVVGTDQERHFHSLKEIICQLGNNWAERLIHVKTGKVLGMSSRLGKVVLLSDIIREASSQFLELTKATPTSKVLESVEEMDEVAKQLAISALFVYDMRQPRTKHYNFEWSSVMQRDNRSGMNLQTTYARLSSLLRKCSEVGLEPLDEDDHLSFDMDSIACQEGFNLLTQLDELDNALHASYWLMEASVVVNYAIKLCKAINRARRSQMLWVLGEQDERKARTRLTLFKSAHKQLELLIKLIGLKPLSKV